MSTPKRVRVYDPLEEFISGEQLKFVDNDEVPPSAPLFIVGQKAALQAFAKESQSLLPEGIREQLNNFVRAGSTEDSCETQTVAYVKDGNSFRKLVIICIPSEASRNNNAARPDAVSKTLVKFPQFSGVNDQPFAAYALGLTRTDAVVTAIAVGRASHLLNFKNGKVKKQENSTIMIWSPEGYALPRERISRVVDGIRMAAFLTEMPTNYLNTTTYIKFIEKLADRLKNDFGAEIGLEIIKGDQLKERGFGGLWNVGKACTANPPALVVLSWNATKCEGKSIVLVGKGIVYDTGGLAIKTKDGMMGMKTDMGGSAGLLGAFKSLVETKTDLHKPLYFIGCLAENSIGADAYRNGDVIEMYSGLNVEINNTDCEGRLVLADGAAYAAKHLSPELVIDMATLTYAQGVATGKSHGAIFSNSEELEKRAFEAGKKSGDLVYPVLFCPELHKAQLHSDIADLKNQPLPGAGCSCAGSFIYENLIAAAGGDMIDFLHVDMAAVCSNLEGRASGFGVALVCQLLGALD